MKNVVVGPPLEANLVETTEVALNEVEDRVDFARALIEVMETDLPGFIIRSSMSEEEGVGTNRELREVVARQLHHCGYAFRPAGAFSDAAKIQNRTEVGLGQLHLDRPYGRTVAAYIDIHTTVHGAGKVILANSGPKFAGVDDLSRMTMYDQHSTGLDGYLLEGMTSPPYVEPKLRVAALEAGDHVIFAEVNKRGPVWHRFDTTTGPRQAAVSELARVPAA